MTDQPQTAPCTAYIESRDYGRQHCARPAGHTDSDVWPRPCHASPLIADAGIDGTAGRVYWDDSHVGAGYATPEGLLAAYDASRTSATEERIEVWPLARVLAEVRCGSRDWTWEEEWADLDQRHADTGYLATLEQKIRENGITMPVLVGSDGRLWDGHHRLRIAVRLGIGYVPVELTTPAPATRAVLRETVAAALVTTRRTDYEGTADHRNHRYDARCALCAGDVDALADAVAAALLPATTRHDTDERIEQAEADAELHARNAETVARERESYRAAWKDEQRRRAEAEVELKRLRCMVDEYGDGAGALTRKLKRVRDLHRETCPSGLSCGMCELLDAPAAPLRRVADETADAETEVHVCKPGATVYYCPTSGETESDCHGGFDVCCDRPDLHQPTDEACQQLAELLDTVRACAEAWAWPSMSAPSRAAGEHLLRLLDAEPAAGARQDGAQR